MDKRLVLQHTQGPHAGLFQIFGVVEEATPLPTEIQAPPGMAVEMLGRRVEFASLITVKPHYVLYREAMPRPTGKFGHVPHPGAPVDGFNPSQV